MDRWDAIGIAGAGLIGSGIHQLVGVAWACIWFGGLLLSLYVLREARLHGGAR